MKIELTKEVQVGTGISSIIGEEKIVWWVRAYNEHGHNQIAEPFSSQEDATKYYEGMASIFKKWGSFKPAPEVILSEII